jgi:membrane protein YqaA with SNARE-associated domain
MTDIINEWGLWGLFTSAFISSTLLPGGSEAILIALALNGSQSSAELLLAATAGNTLGGISSWLIGLLIADYWPTQKLLKKAEYVRAANWLEKQGSPILLLSWLPIVGDPLCLAAGWLKVHFWPALFFIAIGKGLRYIAILLVLN